MVDTASRAMPSASVFAWASFWFVRDIAVTSAPTTGRLVFSDVTQTIVASSCRLTVRARSVIVTVASESIQPRWGDSTSTP